MHYAVVWNVVLRQNVLLIFFFLLLDEHRKYELIKMAFWF